MNRLLYPIVASALITIVPYLLTFEKGQDITRGLFAFEEFALLILIPLAKNKCRMTLPLLIVALFAVAWIDLQNLLAVKGWSTGWYGVLPFVTCSLAIAMMWKVKPFKASSISFILFVTLIAHLFALNQYAAQPLAQFPVVDYMSRTVSKPVARDSLPESFKAKYFTTDSASITRGFIDSAKTNVVVLVESWGIPIDSNRFEAQLRIFDGVPMPMGAAHHRMYSRTRTAEREDLIYSVSRDSTGHRDTLFLPQVLRTKGIKTQFVYGGDSLEHLRYKYIRNVGFDDVFYGRSKENDAVRTDHESAALLDSLLSAQDSALRFIAWTTLDTKFPLQGFDNPYKVSVAAVDSAYTERLTGTLRLVADLAKKHPNARFIVQGDHNPILSPMEFQEKFYKRWVPFVILNLSYMSRD